MTMTSTTQPSTAEDIVDKVGGPGNILGLTHCATRLRFELKDASQIDQTAVESIKGVMGAVPQSGDRYQVVIGKGEIEQPSCCRCHSILFPVSVPLLTIGVA